MSSDNLPIPEKCGAILLPGTPIFPDNVMDLNIFEPRYRKMLEHALEGAWLFAVGVLHKEEDPLYENCVAEIGVLCVINRSETLSDGRSIVSIMGTHLIRFDEWISDEVYPMAKFSVIERKKVEQEKQGAIKSLILDTLPKHLEDVPEELKTILLENIEAIPDLSELIDSVSHAFLREPDLRLEMLCELSDKARASKLIAALS